ncbi:hypothetical protein ASD28_07230 [Massilia sp. Root133]|uniref:DUF4331 family protein n=1 Tax=Massilia sp. Root133 TaxID=1736455 RepID=UPI0006F5BCF2|nr:DUF4331 family protein [Massilia sp. Root133]KQY05855.1 hypothetical protein ASD28_07230 [Massilia sp. Root133]
MMPARLALAAAALMLLSAFTSASDHLDSPKVIADPRVDIGDIYAWTSADGRRLNLVMTVVGHALDRNAEYAFHIDSGPRFPDTTARTDIVCRFASKTQADCLIGRDETIQGDPGRLAGLASASGRSRLFAGLRDDPFFNNVKGSRAAFDLAAATLRRGVPRDAAGCPAYTPKQTAAILDQWRHTDGGPARDFLAGWTPMAIVLDVDLGLVNRGGPVLAVWADTRVDDVRIDRMGRPLTGNGLLAHLGSDEEADAFKTRYNAATPGTAAEFVPVIARSLALYDGYDGRCGNQLMIDAAAPPGQRYLPLARLLADDRLWVDSAAAACTQLFGVELGLHDCGGRTLHYDAVNVYRSLLAGGTNDAVTDGVRADDQPHSDTVFPFL